MLINKFRKDLKLKEYTDLTIILKDDTCEIEMDVHKTVVCMMCKYFENFIKFNNQTEKQSNDKLTVIVPNALITRDIIRNFYDKKNTNSEYPLWRYTLEKIICRDFLMLDYDSDIIKDLEKIPSEGIPLFLEVLSMNNYEFTSMTLLKKNISKGYNFKNISSKIIDELYSYTKPNIIVCMGNENNLELWNIETNKLINNIKLNKPFYHTTNIVCSQNESIIAISDGQIFGLINVLKNTCIYKTYQSKIEYSSSSDSDEDASETESEHNSETESEHDSETKIDLKYNVGNFIKFSRSHNKIIFEKNNEIFLWKIRCFPNYECSSCDYEKKKYGCDYYNSCDKKKYRCVINIDGFPNDKLLYAKKINNFNPEYVYTICDTKGNALKTIIFAVPIKIAKYLPNGKCIVIISKKKILLTNKKFVVKTTLDLQDDISSVCCSQCNKYIIIASGNNCQYIYYLSATNLEILFKFKAHDDSIVHLVSALDGKYIVSSGLDGLIKIWNFKTANLANILPKRDVNRMKFDIMENMWLDIAESIDISFDEFHQS